MLSKENFTIGWVCALQEEYESACRMLDEEVDGPEESEINDPNTYVCGHINGHGVVIGCLPDGRYGTNSAASVASHMMRSFPYLKFGLMVGIGGGTPSKDVRLGDVVVSSPQKKLGGVVQYDLGKRLADGGFQINGHLDSPPEALLGALPEMRRLQGDPRKVDRMGEHLRLMDDMPDYQRPKKEDRLYRADYKHKGGPDCESCEASGLEKGPKPERTPKRAIHVHYGTIASANSVMKDAEQRDRYANDPELNILCFEMEAAGLMNNFPCLVIRGICDYADSHKNDDWHKYAALVAAAYARELLYVLKPAKVKCLPPWADKVEAIKEIVTKTAATVERLTASEDRAILNWLTPMDYGPKQSDNLRMRHPETGQWLLDSTEYRSWQNTAGQILFCPGIPGVGKTTLAATLVDQLIHTYSRNADVGIAFLYCNYKLMDEQTALHLMSSLLKQLAQVQPSLPSCVQSLYDQHEQHQTRASLDEISRAIISLITSFSRVYIIVDALDECGMEYRSKFISELLMIQRSSNANILATSRFIPEITGYFKYSPSIEIHATREDIGKYINSQLSRLPKFVTNHHSLKNDIKEKISDAVQGMFLLARLYFETIIGLDTPKAIQKALKALIPGSSSNIYDSAYNKAMERIMGQAQCSQDRAKQVLSWISCAKRPLTTLELRHALAVESGEEVLDKENIPDAENLISVCAGLVIIDEQSGIIRLVHYTTEEYFRRTKDKWFQDADLQIASSCVDYLSFQTFSTGYAKNDGEFEERLASHPFYDYAAHNWGGHAQKARELSPNILGFLERDAHVEASAQALLAFYTGWGDLDYSQRPPRRTTGLSLAAFFGLIRYITAMIDKHEVDIQDGNQMTPLFWAASRGHEDAMKLLLEAGAKVNSREKSQQTPLFKATYNGHEGALKLLLKAGAEVNSRDKSQQTPLFKATYNGHEGAIKLLLEAGAEVNSRDEYQQTPLFKATYNGHEGAIKLLLKAGAEVNSSDKYQQTPLFKAADYGHKAAIKLLLEAGAEVNLRDESQQTPLFEAAYNGHEAAIKLLLKAGAEVNLSNEYQQTPLLLAASNRHEAAIKLLLEAGAKFDTRDGL